MQPTSTTRGRHALRWVLGVGLVFVVATMVSQIARRRADKRWESVLTHWEEECPPGSRGFWTISFKNTSSVNMGVHASELLEASQEEGNMFWGTRRALWWGGEYFCLNLRQYRSLFSSRINARVPPLARSDQVEAARAILAAVDVEVVIEP